MDTSLAVNLAKELRAKQQAFTETITDKPDRRIALNETFNTTLLVLSKLSGLAGDNPDEVLTDFGKLVERMVPECIEMRKQAQALKIHGGTLQ